MRTPTSAGVVMADRTTLLSVALVMNESSRSLVSVPSIAAAFERIDAALRPRLDAGNDVVDVPFNEVEVDPAGFSAYGLLKDTAPGFFEFVVKSKKGHVAVGQEASRLLANFARGLIDGADYDVFYRFNLRILREAAPASAGQHLGAAPAESTPIRPRPRP